MTNDCPIPVLVDEPTPAGPLPPYMSTTEEKTLKRCGLAHHFRYTLRRLPPIGSSSPSLRIGSATHQGLAVYNEPGSSLQGALDAASNALNKAQGRYLHDSQMVPCPDTDAEFAKEQTMVQAMLTGYDEWVLAEHLNDGWRTVAVEQPIQVPVAGAVRSLFAVPDAVQQSIDDPTRYRIVEYKTVASVTRDVADGLGFNEQVLNYQVAVAEAFSVPFPDVVWRELRRVAPTARTKGPYFRELLIPAVDARCENRKQQFISAAFKADNPEPVVANPSGCCETFMDDWKEPCRKVHEGWGPAAAADMTGCMPRDR